MRFGTPADIEPPSNDDEYDDSSPLPEHLRRVCSCAECGLVFTGVEAFDFHRIGNYDRPGTAGTNTRRCRTPDELREKRYRPNEHGRWGKPEVTA